MSTQAVSSGMDGDSGLMTDVEAAVALENRMSELRAQARDAAIDGDQARAAALRADLARADGEWQRILGRLEAQGSGRTAALPAAARGSLLPLREQVHEALSLLQVPATPKIIAAVHDAFFGSTFPTARLTSLKRDEERSFRAAPSARPYYICPALSAEHLTPSRGLLTISAWPLEQRLIGPDSPRADFLSAAINLAGACERPPGHSPAALQLLAEYAGHIPGSRQGAGPVSPQAVILAAQAELEEIRTGDSRTRATAARRAREQLHAGEQLFGVPPPRPDPVGAGFPAQLAPSAPADRAIQRHQKQEPPVVHRGL